MVEDLSHLESCLRALYHRHSHTLFPCLNLAPIRIAMQGRWHNDHNATPLLAQLANHPTGGSPQETRCPHPSRDQVARARAPPSTPERLAKEAAGDRDEGPYCAHNASPSSSGRRARWTRQLRRPTKRGGGPIPTPHPTRARRPRPPQRWGSAWDGLSTLAPRRTMRRSNSTWAPRWRGVGSARTSVPDS